MKILVIGAAGMLGHQVWKRLNQNYPGDVFGTVRKDISYYEKYNSLDPKCLFGNVDVLEFGSLQEILEKVQPVWIVNCVGLTLRKPDLGDIEKCIEINSMLPHRLALWASSNNSKVIHFSTDCVFDGSKGSYVVSDIPTANDMYGKSKFLGETHERNALTLRLSIVGRELESKTELVEWFLKQKNQTIKGYTRAFYSGLTTKRVGDEVVRIIKEFPQLNGLYQVSSEPISKYDLLRLLNKYFEIHADIEPFDGYCSDKTLDCSEYSRETGFIPPSWDEMIAELAQDRSVDYGD
ncbi:dTDP-4-dehydrorhamnose reductase family protein [Bdellovibrio sp. HCB288]|uniref:dTDP-4-dehydrorhamnose reductase family protein n=1 Tax=Bdellovibrio sp. HCB288 TaxID=3394355 RepID=UPI0039B605A5